MMFRPRCNRRIGYGKGLQKKKKIKMSRSKVMVMLVVFFDWKGTVRHEFVQRGQMVKNSCTRKF